MATVYPEAAGNIAKSKGMGLYLDAVLFRDLVVAQEIMAEHFDTGDAFVTSAKGGADRYLILNDQRGQKAALSIEFGRAAGDRDLGQTWGAMKGLFVLSRSTGLPIVERGPVKL